MANQTYKNGAASVGTTATLLLTVNTENDGVLVQNTGSVVVYFGGPGVTANTAATGGVSLAANGTMTIPSVGGYAHDLYAVVASGTATVSWLQPSVA